MFQSRTIRTKFKKWKWKGTITTTDSELVMVSSRIGRGPHRAGEGQQPALSLVRDSAVVQLNVILSRQVPAPVLRCHALLERMESFAVVVPEVNGSVEGIVH